MPKGRTNRQLAENLAYKILDSINRKYNFYEKAERDGDLEGMWQNQLSQEEVEFLQKQQHLDQEADEIDHAASLLDGMNLKELEDLFDMVKPTRN